MLLTAGMRPSRSVGKVWCRVAAALLACGVVGSAYALALKTDNPDVTATWGNTVRYNAGWRVHKRDPVIANTLVNDESEYSYNNGQLVTNRLDLLSELDFDYKKQMGFRVSAAAWGDAAFHNDVHTGPGLANAGSYTNNQFSSTTKRYYRGPSGEFLDAYAYSNFDVGSLPANLKVGRQTVLWGEALSLSNHSVSYNQTPADLRKIFANPGINAKEAALPVGQVSGSLQVSPLLTLQGQYFYEWAENRLPEGGTYLGVADFLMSGPNRFCLSFPGPCLANAGMRKPNKSGDWGLSARWSPNWLDGGTLGFYAREFDERNFWLTVSPPTGRYTYSFAENAKLYGISVSKNIAGISVGAELVARRNTALQSSTTDTNFQGARGNTTHALVNATAQYGTTPVWSSAAVTGEVGYAHLSGFTSNAALFNGCASKPVGQQDPSFGCTSNSNYVTALSFSPTWVAVRPGMDVTALAKITYGIKGNAPVLSKGSGLEGAGSYTLSVALDYNTKHTFTLAYNGFLATYKANAAGTAIAFSNGDQLQDRGWLSFTYQTSF